MRELLWGSNHNKEVLLPPDKDLRPKDGCHKIRISDLLRQGMNLRTWHQAANFIDYVKGIIAIDPCVYALLVRLCRTVIIKLRRRVIKLTALKWKCTLDSDMTYPGLQTCNPVESDQDDGYWRAQPPMPYPREGVG